MADGYVAQAFVAQEHMSGVFSPRAVAFMGATGKGTIIRRVADMATIHGFEYADETWLVHCACVAWVMIVDLSLPPSGWRLCFAIECKVLEGQTTGTGKPRGVTLDDAESCVLSVLVGNEEDSLCKAALKQD